MYVPLMCLTHGTPLVSQIFPDEVATFAKEAGYLSIGLADVDQLYMCVKYDAAMKKAGLKPMLGIQLKLFGGDEETYVNVYAKNKAGWEELLYIVYKANDPANYKMGPRMDAFEFVQRLRGNLIVIVRDKFIDIFERHCDKDDVYIGLDPISYPEKFEELRGSCLPKVAISPNHYLSPDHWNINRYIFANYLKTTIKVSSHRLFSSNEYYILPENELRDRGLSQEEIDNTGKIYDQIEEFSITYKQELPHFDTPTGITQEGFLRQLCRDGYKAKGLNSQEYIDRIKLELDVIGKADISGYFVIMQDIIRWAKSQGILIGVGRGSAGGCLTSYLTGITNVDPIKYNLLFERFYSADRGGLPDIDTDVPPSKRDKIISYIEEKYGAERFAQLATFNTLKGAAGLKTVFRALGMEASEQNFITKKMPQEAQIAPDLKVQKDETGTDSLILWCINNMDEFAQWCSKEFDGPYGQEFQAAIAIDKVIQGRGRHASAYALANEPIYKKAPLIWDVSAGRYVVGVNMDDAEKLGLVKLDLLGLDLLDKADYIRRRLKNGAF